MVESRSKHENLGVRVLGGGGSDTVLEVLLELWVPLDRPVGKTGCFIYIFTGRNEVLAKVIFLHLSVIHSVHGGGDLTRHPPQDQAGTPPRDQAGTPPREQTSPPPGYGQRSAGTHPTGMHSCFLIKFKVFFTPPLRVTLVH